MGRPASNTNPHVNARIRQLPLRCFKTGLSIVMAASFTSILPAAAYGAQSLALEGWADAAKEAASSGYQTYTTSNFYSAASTESSLPSSYDLRDPNGDGDTEDSVVTPVKLQNPWGTCWGFAAIAASETSVMSKKGTTYAESKLDLSELQLANAVYKNGGAPAKYVGDAQAGEGYNNDSADSNLGLVAGGIGYYGTSIFASGIGPMLEKDATYRNTGIYNNGEEHEDDPVYVVLVTRKTDASSSDDSGDNMDDVSSSDGSEDNTNTTTTTKNEYLTQSQIDALSDDNSVVKYKKDYYAGNYMDENGNMVYTDWTIESQQEDKTDDSWWISTLYPLEDGNLLPETRNLDEDGSFKSVNWDAINIIKDEIYKNENDSSDFSRAVSIGFYADTSMPGDSGIDSQYISTEWAHYTYKDEYANHEVTIVGWDDDYPASNFAKGFENSKEGAAAHTPEGNGAWLVKNSWGSETGDCFDSQNFPSDWGIVDEGGKHTGYFWLSYYDKSIVMPESFDFDITNYTDNEEFVVDEYDYLTIDTTVVNEGHDSPIYAANIFEADADMDLRTISVATYKTDTKVTFQVYLLDEKAKSPTDSKHSTLAYEGSAIFKYGGYHSFHLPKSDWVPMREGQRYAVVTTQQTSDGTYCQGASINGRPQLTTEELDEYGEDYRETLEQSYRASYIDYLTEYYNSKEGIAERGSKSLEEAIEAALDEYMNSEEVVAEIDRQVEEAKDSRAKVYFYSRINIGESMVGAIIQTASGSSIQWTDWTAVRAEIRHTLEDDMVVAVDNASIKAIAELDDFASVDEFEELEAAVKQGKKILKNVVVRSNGKKVSKSKKWMTKANYKKLKSAVTAAVKQLDKAGDYKIMLTMSTPGSVEVKKAAKAITVKIAKTVKRGKA